MTSIKTSLALLTLGASALCLAQEDGPLPNRVARGANLVFLRPTAFGGLLEPGRSESRWGLMIVNESRRRPGVVEDVETWRGTYTLRRGDKAGEWTIEIPVVSRGGGILDGIMQSWENSVAGYHNQAREDFPRGLAETTINGSSYNSGIGLGDVVVARGISVGGFAARAWLKLPTGDADKLLGSGGPDAGFSLERQWMVSPSFTLSLMGSVVAQSKGKTIDGARPVVTTGSATLAWKRNSRDTWLLQVDSESRAHDTGDMILDRTQRVTSLAYRRKINENQDMTFWFSEDDDFKMGPFAASETGSDFTIGLSFRTRF